MDNTAITKPSLFSSGALPSLDAPARPVSTASASSLQLHPTGRRRLQPRRDVQTTPPGSPTRARERGPGVHGRRRDAPTACQLTKQTPKWTCVRTIVPRRYGLDTPDSSPITPPTPKFSPRQHPVRHMTGQRSASPAPDVLCLMPRASWLDAFFAPEPRFMSRPRQTRALCCSAAPRVSRLIPEPPAPHPVPSSPCPSFCVGS